MFVFIRLSSPIHNGYSTGNEKGIDRSHDSIFVGNLMCNYMYKNFEIRIVTLSDQSTYLSWMGPLVKQVMQA